MKKRIFIISISLIIGIIAIGVLFYAVDSKRAKDNKLPIFAFVQEIYDFQRGSAKSYIGLGYKIAVYETENPEERKITSGNIFMKVSEPIKKGEKIEQKEKKIFIAKVLETYTNGSILVEPLEGEEIRESADKIVIKNTLDKTWKVGSTVKIEYAGYLLETYPAQTSASEIEEYIPLQQLPQEYSSEQAIADGYLVSTYQKTYNLNMAGNFKKKVENQEPVQMRVILYTIEGDPIILDVRWEEEIFKVWEDCSRDKFASIQDRKVIYSEYEHMGKIDNRVYLYQGESLELKKGACYLYTEP